MRSPPSNYGNNGFTLVELAIALMVIGLLIGGVLKGQELIENARVTRVVRDIKDYGTAVQMFDLSYNGIPGDIRKPSRIPDCSTPLCNTDGDANRRVGSNITTTATTPVTNNVASERRRFWVHLVKSGMIAGNSINPDYTGTPNIAGIDFPLFHGGGGLLVGFIAPAAGQPLPNRGHHFIVMGQAAITSLGTPAMHFGNIGSFSSATAKKIDMKMDDGLPLTGSVSTPIPVPSSVGCLDDNFTNYGNTSCNLIFLADF